MPGFLPDFVEMHQNLARETGRPFRLKRPTIQRSPLAAERGYAAALVDIIKAIKGDIDEFLVPEIGRISRESGLRGDDAHQDIADVSAVIQGIQDRITIRIDNTHLRALEELVSRYAGEVSKFSRAQTIRQIRRMIGFDAFPKETGLKNILDLHLSQNASLIKTLSGDYVDKVSDSVRRNVQAGARPEVIAQDIQKQFGASLNRARFIARDQTNKLSGNLTQMRQTGLGIEEYYWRTSRDERVRPTHRVKEGNVYRWDDPPADTGHPGHDFLCRCHGEPKLEGAPPPPESKKQVLQEMKDKRAALRERLGSKARGIAKESAAEDRLLARKPKPVPKPKPAPVPKPAPKPKSAPKPTLAEMQAKSAATEAEAAETRAKTAEATASKTALEGDRQRAGVAKAEAEFTRTYADKRAAEARIEAQAKRKRELVAGRSPFKASLHPERPTDKVTGRQFDALEHWTRASNMWEAGAIKRAAKLEFSLEGVPFTHRLNKYTAAQMQAARQSVRGIYTKTQEELQRRGVKAIKLYRGIDNKYTTPGVTESWTTSLEKAKEFAGPKGTVLIEEVPATRILTGHEMPLWRNGPHGQEHEWIVMT